MLLLPFHLMFAMKMMMYSSYFSVFFLQITFLQFVFLCCVHVCFLIEGPFFCTELECFIICICSGIVRGSLLGSLLLLDDYFLEKRKYG